MSKEELKTCSLALNMGLYAANIANISAKEFYLDVDKCIKAQKWVYSLHQVKGDPIFNIPDWGCWDFGEY